MVSPEFPRISLMDKNNNKLLSLKQIIYKAFEKTKYPGDDNLALHSALSGDLITSEFKGLCWQDLKAKFLHPRFYDALPEFTPDAYRYYLPGFMLVAAENYDEVDLIPSFVVYSLIPVSMEEVERECKTAAKDIEKYPLIDRERLDPVKIYEKDRSWFVHRNSEFTYDQIEAIIAFLDFMREEHGGDISKDILDRASIYWRKVRDTGSKL
jgi:hypothetical protein